MEHRALFLIRPDFYSQRRTAWCSEVEYLGVHSGCLNFFLRATCGREEKFHRNHPSAEKLKTSGKEIEGENAPGRSRLRDNSIKAEKEEKKAKNRKDSGAEVIKPMSCPPPPSAAAPTPQRGKTRGTVGERRGGGGGPGREGVSILFISLEVGQQRFDFLLPRCYAHGFCNRVPTGVAVSLAPSRGRDALSLSLRAFLRR